MEAAAGSIIVVGAVILGIWLYILLPAQMAEKRNRIPLVWVLISLVASPVLAVLLLLALGDAKA